MEGRDQPPTFTAKFAGEDYQHVRFLLRRGRQSLVAINGYSIPIVDEILRYGHLIPTVRSSLIALAKSHKGITEDAMSTTSPSSDNGVDSLTSYLTSYQSALSELRLELSQLDGFRAEFTSSLALQGALASALLLTVFAMPIPELQWEQHVNGLISVIQSINYDELCSTRLGQFVAMHTAQCDISAFSLGRQSRSINAWYHWHTLRFSQIDARRNMDLEDGWFPHEICVGYPISLLDVVAQLCKWVEDEMRFTPASGGVIETSELQSIFLLREALIYSWTPPTLPQKMPTNQKLALSTGWEIIRRAALIFLWRGRGFHSDYRYPIRKDRAHMIPICIREVIAGVRGLIDAYKTNRITMGNAMLWPLTVIACECIGSQTEWQSEVAFLFESLKQSFAIRHTTLIRSVLMEFWGAHASLGTSSISIDSQANILSLEAVVRMRGWVLPLL